MSNFKRSLSIYNSYRPEVFPLSRGFSRDFILLITQTCTVPTLEHIEFRACNRQLEFMKLDPNVQLGTSFLVNDFKFTQNCWTRNGFFKCSVDKEITLTNSVFENSRADWQFVIFDGGCALQEITFTSCTGQILKMDKSKKVSVHGCKFTGCSGNLIEITQTSGFSLADCCFQGTTNGYDIKVDSGSVVCDYPLCFSRNRDASVKFASYPSSLTALEKRYQIFGCTACDNPPPAPTPTPSPVATPTQSPVATPTRSPVPEPTPTGEIPPEPEETTTSDEEASSEPSATVTNPYPAEPTGGQSGAKQGNVSAGGIVGILIALLLCVALLVIIIILLLRRRRKEKSDEPAEGEMAEETIDETITSFDSYDTANTEFTEDNPLFAQELELPESEFNNYEENWI